MGVLSGTPHPVKPLPAHETANGPRLSYLRRISRTKIQMSQMPPVISVRIASNKKLPKPYFLVFPMRGSIGVVAEQPSSSSRSGDGADVGQPTGVMASISPIC
mgnify:CR=1 FL=1